MQTGHSVNQFAVALCCLSLGLGWCIWLANKAKRMVGCLRNPDALRDGHRPALNAIVDYPQTRSPASDIQAIVRSSIDTERLADATGAACQPASVFFPWRSTKARHDLYTINGQYCAYQHSAGVTLRVR
jgi:hypothetical protein